MSGNRISAILTILKGLIVSIAVTLAGMLLLALWATFGSLADSTLTAMNQLLKLASIVTGVCIAVGRGGRRGFATGAALALIYAILGYGLYLALGGGYFSAASMLGEILLCAAAGAVTGAVCANLPPRSKGRRKK